jgi:hypothetical protein
MSGGIECELRGVFASVISTLNGHSLIISEVPTALKWAGG